MSAVDDNSKKESRRKDGTPFAEGNTRADGGYLVGKGRPPAAGKFAVDDGRRRGRRAAGVRNADTEFQNECNRKVTINEGGKKRKVSKSQASDIRLLDNAYNKGQTIAIIEVDRRRQRIAESKEVNRRYHTQSDAEILESFLRSLADELGLDPRMFGDCAPEPQEPGDA